MNKFEKKQNELMKFLNWIDKSTYWKQDSDVTNSQVVDEYLLNIIRFNT